MYPGTPSNGLKAKQ